MKLDPDSKVAENKDAVIAQYNDAVANMALINTLIAAYEDYDKYAKNDLTEAALLAAYDAINTAGIHPGATWKLLNGEASPATTWADYETAYKACQRLNATADAALVTAAKNALNSITWDAIDGADLTDATLKAEILKQINAKLTAANITGVTVSLDGYGVTAPPWAPLVPSGSRSI